MNDRPFHRKPRMILVGLAAAIALLLSASSTASATNPTFTSNFSFSYSLDGNTAFFADTTPDVVKVRFSSLSCSGCNNGAGTFTVQLEKKACGFWGCSWQSISSAVTISVPNDNGRTVSFNTSTATTTSLRLHFANTAPGTNTKYGTVYVS